MKRWILSALLWSSGVFLFAQGYGLQINATRPFRDLKEDVDSHTVISGGAFLFLDEYDGHVIKPRLDITRFYFPDYLSSSGVEKGHAFTLTMASLGFDYNYYFSEKGGEGWYLLLGGMFNTSQSTWKAPAPLGPLSEINYDVSGCVGFGTVFMPHCGVEVRGSFGNRYKSFTPDGSVQKKNMVTLSVGFVFLF